MYILKNDSGKYVLRSSKGNECLMTSDPIRAARFETFEEASDFRSTLVTESNFQIKNIEDNISLRKGHVNESLKDMQDIQSIMSSLSSRITDILEEEDYCHKRLDEIKLELVDISHCIELYNMSASDGYKKAKMLQDTLRERRQLKDRLVEIDILKHFNPNIGVIKRFNGVSERRYTPRRIPELFQ